ncbi:MAG: restriction endonuclease subunit S [Gallionella sp.]
MSEISALWGIAQLGELCSITTGDKDVNEGNPSGEFPFFTCAQESSKSNSYSFDGDAILIAGNGNFSVKNYKGKFEAYQRTYVLQNFKISPAYLYYFISHRLSEITKDNRGSTIRYIRIGNLTDYDVTFPCEQAQHRIVAKIEELFSELDKGIENLKTARAQLKVYRQALLKHAFEGKLTAQWRAERRTKSSVTPAQAGVHANEKLDSRLPPAFARVTGNDEMGGGHDEPLETAAALLKRIQQERAQRYQQQLADWQKSPSVPLLQRGKTTRTAATTSHPPLKKGGRGDLKPKATKPLPPLTTKELADLPELPEGWGWTRLGNTNVEVSDGPFGSNLKSSDYVDSGVRVVRLENIGALKFIEEKESYVTEEKYELLKRHTVTSGDIVFSSFIIENVRVALVPPSITKAINKADCFCVRFSGETLSNVYAVLFLSTRHVYKQLESLIHGVGRPRINTTQLKDVFIPVCGAAEQQVIIAEIESRLSEVAQLELTLTTSLQQAEALRQSILKKAFAGLLVPQDPHDEPASRLLARIQAERATVSTKPRKSSTGDKLSLVGIAQSSLNTVS